MGLALRFVAAVASALAFAHTGLHPGGSIGAAFNGDIGKSEGGLLEASLDATSVVTADSQTGSEDGGRVDGPADAMASSEAPMTS